MSGWPTSSSVSRRHRVARLGRGGECVADDIVRVGPIRRPVSTGATTTSPHLGHHAEARGLFDGAARVTYVDEERGFAELSETVEGRRRADADAGSAGFRFDGRHRSRTWGSSIQSLRRCGAIGSVGSAMFSFCPVFPAPTTCGYSPGKVDTARHHVCPMAACWSWISRRRRPRTSGFDRMATIAARRPMVLWEAVRDSPAAEDTGWPG